VISIKISDAKCFSISCMSIISLPVDMHTQYFPATVRNDICVYVYVYACVSNFWLRQLCYVSLILLSCLSTFFATHSPLAPCRFSVSIINIEIIIRRSRPNPSRERWRTRRNIKSIQIYQYKCADMPRTNPKSNVGPTENRIWRICNYNIQTQCDRNNRKHLSFRRLNYLATEDGM